MRATTSGGTPNSGSNYAHEAINASATAAAGGGSDTSADISSTTGDASDETGNVELEVLNPQGATYPCTMFFVGISSGTTTTVNYYSGAVLFLSATAVDGVQVFPSSGVNMTGTVKLYRRARPT